MVPYSAKERVRDSETYMRQMVAMAHALIQRSPERDITKYRVLYEIGRTDDLSKKMGLAYNDFMIVFSSSFGVILEHDKSQGVIKYSIGSLKDIAVKVPGETIGNFLLRERLELKRNLEKETVPLNLQSLEFYDDAKPESDEDTEERFHSRSRD
jgi:hypothetical protein